MGLFDFMRSDKKKEKAAEKAAEQVQQHAADAPAPPAAMSGDAGTRYTDSAAATKAAAERMAAAAPKPAPAPPSAPPLARPASHTPTPTSAAHKAVPAAPAPAPKMQRSYTVRPGDSLSAIARRELGNEGRWRELYAMNKGVIGSNPDMIHPGQKLTLPS
ncbi:LysM peptidoglycan-binding domain-containing protein [Streptomyces sp. ISL-43]|uniref:LysM peptidoglycan-binding domain-containing protein n=1 Tax=Streptomyces sp. ISL-43 TaxID=2819183 RepID=UPI001BEC24E7|nr:LysM domain-containing protein [Streptomyces sp. ISL-43]MBT2446374.1 LysM peptidoglycan-binding domain-containing protein [Streptomyces sp. ISL-43]